jgi:hypothetical protein
MFMNVSDRYRALIEEVEEVMSSLRSGEEEDDEGVRIVEKASLQLKELKERVGEIPRIRLEFELTPVLLKAHGQLDRARLLLEEQGEEDRAAAVWGLEQKIYRLLNEL